MDRIYMKSETEELIDAYLAKRRMTAHHSEELDRIIAPYAMDITTVEEQEQLIGTIVTRITEKMVPAEQVKRLIALAMDRGQLYGKH